MTKWICENKECRASCVMYTENCAPQRCVNIVIDGICNWQEVKEDGKPNLPKLTAEIFDRPDCPEWAEYAAVDKNGHVFVFDHEPECTHSSWYKRTQFGSRYELCNGYDSSDYEHSLVRRSEQKQESVTNCNQLPDWCKVGEWVYYFDEVDGHSYQKIDKIDDKYIYFYRKFDRSKPSDPLVSDRVVYSVFIENTKQARLRPYNADEMKALVGKVIETKADRDVVLSLVTECRSCDDLFEVLIGGGNHWHTARGLVGSKDHTIDGKPCGKFEHLNDAGEWVE